MALIRSKSIKIILGGAAVGDKSLDPLARFDTPGEVKSYLEAFSKRGYGQIDTSRMYGSSESRLGAVSAADSFAIDTKVMSWEPGCHTRDKILEGIEESLDNLRVPRINIEYLHVPDRTTPFDEACEAMNIAHKAGKIKSWGLSNYKAEEVQQILDICEHRGFVKPSVYQGQYNAVVRGGETALFPLLRKYDMAFYAYSPAAGGFFAGNYKTVQEHGRWDTTTLPGQIYSTAYLKPLIIRAAEKSLELAANHGISGHAMALRWTIHHGALDSTRGDAIIIAASNLNQLEANLDAVEAGPLPPDVASALEILHAAIGDDAVPYHL